MRPSLLLNSTTVNPSEFLLLAGAMEAKGYAPADFELLEDPAPDLSVLLGLPDHLLTMRRRSTGHERLYIVQPGAPWLFKALADLGAGLFGPGSSGRGAPSSA